jgi:hypothetical protein
MGSTVLVLIAASMRSGVSTDVATLTAVAFCELL